MKGRGEVLYVNRKNKQSQVLALLVFFVLGAITCIAKPDPASDTTKYKPFNYVTLSLFFVKSSKLPDSVFKIVEQKTVKVQSDTEKVYADTKLIDGKLKVYFHQFYYHEPELPFPDNCREYLTVGKQKIMIDRLFLGHNYKEYQPLQLEFAAAYEFNFVGASYMALYLNHRLNPTAYPNYYIILLKIESDRDQRKITAIGIDEQASYDTSCFADVNEDGILDLIYWYRFSDQVRLKSLWRNQFIDNKNYFLKLRYISGEPMIDLERSNWE